ncbi:MAG: hypothetical protein EB127_11680 [Alphaproteobacteria bacterium]|nr:hypothetical protein [Alphaproteobacteria bacterium]
MKMNLRMENTVSKKADTPDNVCYRDRVCKSSTVGGLMFTLRKMPDPRYREGNQLNATLMSGTW